MSEDEVSLLDRPIPAVVMQIIGLACLLTATAVLFDGWYVIGVLGLALVFGRTDEINDAIVLLRHIARKRRNGHG